MAANLPRFAIALLLALVSLCTATPVRAADGTVVVSARIAPRLALHVAPAEVTASGTDLVSPGDGVPLGAIVVHVESNTEWDGLVAVETSDWHAPPSPDVPLVALHPISHRNPPTDVGIGAVPWTKATPAGRSIETYDIVLLPDGGRSLPSSVALVIVVRADGGELTATARIEVGQRGDGERFLRLRGW
jgi:hypothetical protein